MKTLLLLLSTLPMFGQCPSVPGGALCSKGASCTQSGFVGLCKNAAKPGGSAQCVCNFVNPNSIPLDYAWQVYFHQGNIIPTLGGPVVDYGNDFNPAADGLLTSPATLRLPTTPEQGPADYFYRNLETPLDLSGGRTLTVVLSVTADAGAQINYTPEPTNTCLSPAKIRPIIMVTKFPDVLIIGNQPPYGTTGRWWGSEALAISEVPASVNAWSTALGSGGNVTLTIPLDFAHWSGIFGGSSTEADFTSTLGHVGSIGVTMGAGCFAGHGINAQGNVTVKILGISYSALP